jgi:hypothetical protein
MDTIAYNLDRLERGRFAAPRGRTTPCQPTRKPPKSHKKDKLILKSNSKSKLTKRKNKQPESSSKSSSESSFESQENSESLNFDNESNKYLNDKIDDKLNEINEQIDLHPRTLHQNEKIDDMDYELRKLMNEIELIKSVQLKFVETLTRLVSEVNNIKSRMIR